MRRPRVHASDGEHRGRTRASAMSCLARRRARPAILMPRATLCDGRCELSLNGPCQPRRRRTGGLAKRAAAFLGQYVERNISLRPFSGRRADNKDCTNVGHRAFCVGRRQSLEQQYIGGEPGDQPGGQAIIEKKPELPHPARHGIPAASVSLRQDFQRARSQGRHPE